MKHLSLRLKLTLTFLLLAILVGIVNIYQIQSLQTINTKFIDLVHNDSIRLQLLTKLQQYNLEIENEIYRSSNESRIQTTTNLTSLKNKITKLPSEYTATTYTNSETKNTIDSIIAKEVKVADSALALYQSPPSTTALINTQKQQIANDQADLSLQLKDTISNAQKRLDAQQQQIAELVAKTNQIAVLATALVVVSAVLLGVVSAARLARSLNRVRIGAQRIANGNFTELISVTSGDEIGQVAETFNQMSTRLKDSYSRLAVEKQRDETILQNMGEGLIAVDEKAQIVLMNNVATSLLDLGDASKAIGKLLYPLFDLYEQNKKQSVVHKRQHPIYEALTKGKTVNEIFNFKKKDLRTIMINFSANPIILDGDIVGAIVVLRDVTHEREVDRMKTEFISLASHQLRTPLSAIKWFSEMLLSGDAGKLKGDQIDFAKNIVDSTERMIELVNSLLNISRIESGRIMVDPKPTDLKELVSGIVTDLKAKTEERQQTLIVSVHADLPKINLDPRLIGQVYLNLLTNAVKYTPKGGEISVFISKKDDQVVSQVTDNGYGIPKEQQGRIFQKFFRAENVAKVETDGTGLGLYLIKAIVESSGGKIWFDSEENKGTTFWFSIPLSGMKPKEGEVTLDA